MKTSEAKDSYSSDKAPQHSRPTSVSLIIPIYNESSHLEEFLRLVDSFKLPLEKELVIVDDCSKDNSAEIVDQFEFKSTVAFVRHSTNLGKGAAIRTGIEKATGDIIGIQDADFEYDLEDIPKILQPFIEQKADVVCGSRFSRTNQQVHRTFHYLVNRFLTLFSNLLSGLYLSDMETCYKFFRADIIKNIVLESNRFSFEPEVIAKIAKLKIRVMEVPISYFPRNYIEGKKITWKDGVSAVFHIIRYNIFRNRKDCVKPDIPKQFIPRDSNLL
jgi:glycosyltransferase involved in cell wall biosynthesis